MDTQFVGEQLLPGKIGQFFIILSFASAVLAAVSYYFDTIGGKDNSWKKIARTAVFLNMAAVIGIGSSLFYIIYNHLFEYHYAWAHSSKALPVHYIISCFWEGQEGSFWLWTFWQGILSVILVFRAKKWESPVLTTVMFSQVFLASMLLGVELFGLRIGSSPFILLRNAIEGPIFSRPDYLSLVEDGNGLNPLLQNYWMVIHPPTLFLGFASMIVPFSYAIAGLWQRKFKEWITPALPWTLFAVMILGTGIIMGSFWAYEALNFGGFWAWDPVENASIIPWITLIAAVHVLIAYKNSGHSYFTATFLVLISFVLVLYASFLTRSGILGETSVHAFTDLGMFGHLILYLVVFMSIAAYFLVSRWRQMPITKKDEETYSREFWLFIGALVLTLACVQIIATTSIPVFNRAFGTDIAPPTDIIKHFNKWQAPMAIVVALVSAFSQFLKYKKTDPKKFFISIGITAIVSLLLTAVVVYFTKVYTNAIYILLTFSAIFSILCNARILTDAFKGKWRLAGSSIAHIGFALILIGALVAAATSKVISVNSTAFIPVAGFEKADKPGDNLMLYLDQPVRMGDYFVTYKGDSVQGPNTFYKVNYQKKNSKGELVENFNLFPNAQQNPKMGLVASPSTRHKFLYDIYTHVTAAPAKLEAEGEHEPHEGHSEDEEYDKPVTHEVSIGDTIKYRDGFILVKGINREAKLLNIPLSAGDAAIGLELEINAKDKKYNSEPVFLIKGRNRLDFGKTVDEAGLKLRFTNVMPEKKKLELMVYQKPADDKKWIVMKAIQFPYINLLWGGTIIMIIGFLFSIFRRRKEVKLT